MKLLITIMNEVKREIMKFTMILVDVSTIFNFLRKFHLIYEILWNFIIILTLYYPRERIHLPIENVSK